MTPIVSPLDLCCMNSPPEEHGEMPWLDLPRRCNSCQRLNIFRQGQHDSYTAMTINRTVGCEVLHASTFLMGSLVFITYHLLMQAPRLKISVYQDPRALWVGSNRLLPSPAFSPFSFLEFLLSPILDFLSPCPHRPL